MFGVVWGWAGIFRKTNKNIGVDKWHISVELRTLLDDLLYWHQNQIYDPDERAIRFKHWLVSIHCFPNGNGRHSRLIADLVVEKLYQKLALTWGSRSHTTPKVLREKYLNALRQADIGEMDSLVKFARS